MGEREIEEKDLISHLWFEEKHERMKFKTWDPHVFGFSTGERRKRRESDDLYGFYYLTHVFSIFDNFKMWDHVWTLLGV